MLRRILLVIRKGLLNLWADRWLNLVTVVVIALCLTLVGAFLMLAANGSALLSRFAGNVEVMVYLNEGHSPADLQKLQAAIQADPVVQQVTFVSKDQALARFTQQLGEAAGVIDQLQKNPLPNSLEVRLAADYREIPDMERFAAKYTGSPAVEEIYYGREWVERLARIVRTLWIVGGFIGVFLAGTAVFIISTTIRLAIHRRKDEIAVMRLVGATNRFIQAPFLIEGSMQGLIGAAGSVGGLYLTYLLLSNRGLAGGPVTQFFPGFTPIFLGPSALAALMIMGVILGFIGSLVSTGRHLKV
jgi:cell division transport system permease protein